MKKGIDTRNGSKKTAAVATGAMQTGVGDNGGPKEMTATAAVYPWIVIGQRQQQETGDCGSNGGGANLAWLGSSGKTARRQQNQRQNGRNINNGGGADWTWWKGQCQRQWKAAELGMTIAEKRRQ